QEQVLADLQPRLVQADIAAETGDQGDADAATDQVADVVAQDRARGGDRHHGNDAEIVRRAGIERGREQRRLAGHGNADGFEGDHGEQHPQAVGVDEVFYAGEGKEIHDDARSWKRHTAALMLASLEERQYSPNVLFSSSNSRRWPAALKCV